MDWPAVRSVYRSLGEVPGFERVGSGVMDKSGVSVDHYEYSTKTYSLIYVLRGRGTYIDAQGREYPLSQGSYFQRVPGIVHTTRLDPDSRWLESFYDLGPGIYATLAATRVLRPEPCAFHPGFDLARLRRMTKLCNDLEAATELELPRLCAEVIIEIVKTQALALAPQFNADAIDRACRLLGSHVSERDPLAAFCAREGLDYERFRKQFQKRTGVSPGQYRIRRRMDRACELLEASDLSLENIALELGYSSPYEFSAQFSRRMGMPPSRYRKLGRSQSR